MNRTPTISIIIPCYNQERYIAETLESVMAQTFSDWEAIIMDDGSTDNSKNIISIFLEKDERFHYYHQENQGLPAARNNAIKQSHGKYILPLDADDIIDKSYTEKAVSYLNEHPECTVYYCHGMKFGDISEPVNAVYTNYQDLLLYNSFFCSVVYRRSDYDRIGGYDESFKKGYEDWEFMIRLLNGEKTVYQDHDIMFFYRFHNKEKASMIISTEKVKDQLLIDIYTKHQAIYNKYYPNTITANRILLDYNNTKEALNYYKNEYEKITRAMKQQQEYISHANGTLFTKNRKKTNLFEKITKQAYLIYLLNFSKLKNYRSDINKKVKWSEVKSVWNSDLFDASYYKTASGIDLDGVALAIHYIYIGHKSNIEPSLKFSGKAYKITYPDIENAGLCPLLHYLQHGYKEGRIFFSQDEINDCDITYQDQCFIKSQKGKGGKSILLVSHELSQTGAPRALLNLAIALKQMGVTPVIWSLLPGPLKAEIEKNGISCKVVPLLFSNYNGDTAFTPEVAAYVSLFDMVLLNTIVALPKIEFFRNIKIRKTCWIHDGAYGFSCSPFTDKFNYYYTLYDRIYVVGNYAMEISKSFAKGSSIPMQNLLYGINDTANSQRTYKPDRQHVTMLLAGTIERRKGQDILLESLKYLPKEILQKLTIYIAGKPVDEELSQALQNDNSGCISFKGALSHEELLKVMESIDILLCPSIDDPMPIVCTEAMMLSKPVIVSDKTGTAYFLRNGENGFVVEAGNPQSLADAIKTAVSSTSNLPLMGKKAREIYEQNFTEPIFKATIQEQILTLL